ncbi:Tigger transposable element-derived protein 7-like 58, partial [Homarus americanus]
MLKNKELEEAVYKWIVQQRACEVKVRGVETAEAANKQAQHLGIPFKASDGWLWRFRNHHGICNRKLHGEAGSAQTEEVELFKQKLNQGIGVELGPTIFNFAALWKDVKMSTLADSWKKLLHDTKPELDLSCLLYESLDNVLTYIDSTSNPQIHHYYEHLRTLRELIIREQYNAWKQLKLDSSFKPVNRASPASQPS